MEYQVTHADSVDGTVSAISIEPWRDDARRDVRSLVTAATLRVTSDRRFCCYVMGHFEVVFLNRAGNILPVDGSEKSRLSYYAAKRSSPR
jgi:hypothetical protein